jgi:serine/threonine-protein kinase
MGAERSGDSELTDIVTSDVPTAVPGIGASIGPYRVVRKLGSGGMGVVYEAVHKQIGRQAAIKLLHAQFAVQKDIVSRFLNEARAANLVRHPGIVDIYEFGTTQSGNAYIVMEYIDGVSLASRLKQSAGPLGVAALPLFQKMAQALAAAHEKGIVHRDLKPDNVMIIADRETAGGERIKILDFGIAKLSLGALAAGEQDRDEPESGTQPEFKTRTGAMMGTPAYMAPEQCRGAEQVTDRTDVYSFGLMLYRALSGNPALVGRSDLEYLLLHTTAQPLNLHDIYQVDAELSALVHAMLAKEPAQRPAMAELAPRLGQLASRLLDGAPPTADQAAAGPAALQVTARIRRDPPSAAPLETGAAEKQGSGPREGTTTLGASTGHLRRPPPKLPRAAVRGGSALAAVLAVGLFALLHRRAVAPPPPRPAAAAVDPVAATPPRPLGAVPGAARVHWEVSSTPQGALVISTQSNDVLGVTPWRHEREAGQGPFSVVLRLPNYQDAPVTLDSGRDAVIQLVLSPVTAPAAAGPLRPVRPAGRGKGAKTAPPSPHNLTNADLPVVE